MYEGSGNTPGALLDQDAWVRSRDVRMTRTLVNERLNWRRVLPFWAFDLPSLSVVV